jgi:lipopolysaccharide/colanic/teichoic acid biosynthesis glycosyltransferase
MLQDRLEQDEVLPRWSGYPIAKRMLDVGVCLVISPLIVLLVSIIAAAILLTSGRPIFFIQRRVGRNNRLFRIYKFRTLKPDYDESSGREFMKDFVHGRIGRDDRIEGRRLYKPFDDTQVTGLGRILRKTSLDELPQILNVLLGNMSLVGPRPNVPWEVAAYKLWHNERLKVLPGITGLAQVRGRSCISFDDIVQCDIEYIEKQSLKLDLQILWLTVLSMFDGHGAG